MGRLGETGGPVQGDCLWRGAAVTVLAEYCRHHSERNHQGTACCSPMRVKRQPRSASRSNVVSDSAALSNTTGVRHEYFYQTGTLLGEVGVKTTPVPAGRTNLNAVTCAKCGPSKQEYLSKFCPESAGCCGRSLSENSKGPSSARSYGLRLKSSNYADAKRGYHSS
jgi:hypothetical protein